jgi:hypothetical protein
LLQIAQNRVTAYSGGAACADASLASEWRRVANPIFISYRRDDSEGEAGRLFDDLTREFGAKNVFMDVAGIRPGVDFVKAIETNVADCGVLLAVIGPTWATITNAHGLRRLDDPSDFVVLEIASALKREVPVIPVLVHAAKMPTPDQLPESLKDFSHRNSVELSHTRWPTDVSLLVEALKSYVVPTKDTTPEPVHANVPVQLPPPHQPGAPAAVSPKPNRSSSVRWIAALAGVVIVAAAVTFFRAHQSPPPQPMPASQPAPALQPAPTPEPAPAPNPVTAAPVNLSALAGRWRDPVERDADSLVILLISGSSSNLTIQAYGTCKPKLCDWGTEQAVVDGQSATATFKVPNLPGRKGEDRVASVRVSPSGSNLDVQVHNTFRVGDQSRTSGIHQVFLPVHH